MSLEGRDGRHLCILLIYCGHHVLGTVLQKKPCQIAAARYLTSTPSEVNNWSAEASYLAV